MINNFRKTRVLFPFAAAFLIVMIAEPSTTEAGRGGGGRGGGGGFRGGGGGGFRGGGGYRGGGGGGYRGGGGFARSPSFNSRPNYNPGARPNLNQGARTTVNRNNNFNNLNRNNFNNVNRNNNFNNLNRNNFNNININRAMYNRPGYGGGLGYGRGLGGYGAGYHGYRPGWGYHQNWVNGYWGGPRYGGLGYGGFGYPGYGYGGYGYGMGGFGLGMLGGLGMGGLLGWGLGSSLYGMGYSSYANPYYSSALYSQPVVAAGAGYSPAMLASSYDYSQPISTESEPPEAAASDPAVSQFADARAAFMAGDYPKALDLTDRALKALPNDSAIHEFRALVLFALKQYDYAAGTLYAVLSVGPGWDWTTLIRLYPNVEVYTAQLRALEEYRDAHPDSASAHFVLGYQYLTQGHTDAGVRELKEVARLKPQDHLASELIAALSPPASNAGGAGAAPGQATAAAGEPPDAKAVAAAAAAATKGGPESKVKPPDEASFAGNWKSNPSGDVTIDLAINPDKKFSWSVTNKGQTRKFDGEYTYGGDVLTLVQTNGTAMVGKLAWPDESHFNFRVAGTTPDDPGLTFAR
jgi:tetratricopeptide (TPR) repeat protein